MAWKAGIALYEGDKKVAETRQIGTWIPRENEGRLEFVNENTILFEIRGPCTVTHVAFTDHEGKTLKRFPLPVIRVITENFSTASFYPGALQVVQLEVCS